MEPFVVIRVAIQCVEEIFSVESVDSGILKAFGIAAVWIACVEPNFSETLSTPINDEFDVLLVTFVAGKVLETNEEYFDYMKDSSLDDVVEFLIDLIVFLINNLILGELLLLDVLSQ